MRWHLLLPASLLLIFIATPPSLAAFQFLDMGARPTAMGGAFCAVADDALAAHYNPAGMAQVHGRKVALNSGRLFGLDDLACHSFSMLQPFRWAVLGLGAQRFGGTLYRESSLSLSLARPLGNSLFLGLSLRGLQLAISDYGVDHALVLDLGVLAALNRRLKWGLSVRNLSGGHLGRQQEGIPQNLVMGFAFRPHAGWLLSADLGPDLCPCSEGTLSLARYPILLRLGEEFCLWPPFTLRLGLQTRPTRFSGGMGVRAGPLRLDYCYRSHPILGGSHHVSLSSP